MSELPLFPVTTVGSWPRPPRVAEALRQFRRKRIDRAEFDRIVDAEVVELLRLQDTLGCDIVTDGELRRDNFYSFVSEKLAGVRLMTLAEMLEVVEDKAGVRAPAADARRSGLLDQQSQSAPGRSIGASRWPATISASSGAIPIGR